MTCKNHPGEAPLLSWRPMVDGRRHILARCPKCLAFLGWAPQTPENAAAADLASPRQNQGDLFSGREGTQ